MDSAGNSNIQFGVGDHVQTRKPHPCGSDEWVIFRVGADIGLRCLGCGRRVLLTRSKFVKGLKHISRAASHNAAADDVEKRDARRKKVDEHWSSENES